MTKHEEIDEATSVKEPAIGISLTVQTGEDTNLVFQTHVGRDSEREKMSSLVRDMQNVATRMKYETLLPLWLDKLAGYQRSYERAIVDMEKIDLRNRQIPEGKRLPNNVAKDRDNAQEGINRWKVEISTLSAQIDKAQRFLNEG